MYNNTLQRGRKYFCQAFSAEEILKCYVKDCFKMNGQQMIKMLKNDEYVRFKNYERNIKSPFVIFADFENILVPEDNTKLDPSESYTNKNQKYVACSYDYKLLCFDDKFSKPFKSYLGEDVVYNFINSMVKEIKYSSDAMKKHFNKEVLMTKKDNEDFKNSTKF